MRNKSNEVKAFSEIVDRVMIACCNDGTRPVIFKIERIDYE